MPAVAMTVGAYTEVRCASPIPLDEPPYTTPAEKNPCFSHIKPPVTSSTKTSSQQRPSIQRGPSSNLVTRWNRVDVPDSVLIAELEELRRNVELANGNFPSDDHGLVSDFRCNSCTYGSSSQDDERRWKKTQKSAFCRRELIKTELTYLEGVLQLENKNVSELKLLLGRSIYPPQCRSPPPTLLLAYLPALTATSCQLLDHFLFDPTAHGVSLAFVEFEQQLEEAFVPWCSVVGSAFTNNPSRSRSTGSIAPRKLIKQASKQISAFDRWKSSEILHTNSAIPSSRVGSSGNVVTNVFRRLSKGSTSSAPSRPMSSENSSTGSLISDSAHSAECPSSPPVFQHSNSEELPCGTTRRHESYPCDSRRYLSCIESSRPREPSKTSSFRELAILPTQRVTRYVLLFRGSLPLQPSWNTGYLIDYQQICLPIPPKPAAIAQL